MPKHKIALVMSEFLVPGKDLVYSGGDRYTLDMVRMVRAMGDTPVIFQRSPNGEVFDTEWEGARVIGLPSKRGDSFNIDVAQNTQEYRVTVYFNMQLAHPRVHKRSVSISHGLWFDHVDMAPCADDKWAQYRLFLQCLVSGVDRIVSVDTNTINYFGALFSGRYHHKFKHIPNSVDIARYTPVDRKGRKGVRVLYPRRAEVLRGLTEMQRVAESLTAKYKHAEFHFCGRGHSEQAETAMADWAGRKERIEWSWRKFDDMPAVYQQADFAVIPTIGCEGTSYALLESLASGLPVVSTYVGGLSELVIDGYNGLKVAPALDEIRDAVDYLIRKPGERERMGLNARRVAEQFSSEKWRLSWGEVLSDLMR